MKSFPRRRMWLIPAIIATVIFIGGVASNLVASDIQEAVKPYRRWVWGTFVVALVVTIIAAIDFSFYIEDVSCIIRRG